MNFSRVIGRMKKCQVEMSEIRDSLNESIKRLIFEDRQRTRRQINIKDLNGNEKRKVSGTKFPRDVDTYHMV